MGMIEATSGSTSDKRTMGLAISAIKNLREIRGSTSRDIINYVTKGYKIDRATVRKQVKNSLKRGLSYGILSREYGNYSLPTETEDEGKEIASQEIGLMEMCGKKRVKRLKNNNKYNNRKTDKNRKRSAGNNSNRCGKRNCRCTGAVKRNGFNRKNKSVKNTSDYLKLGKLFEDS